MGQHGWDASSKMAEDASSGGIFLRLKDHKDKTLVVFCGAPFSREVFWDGKKQTYLDAESDEGKAYADNHPDKKPAFRSSVNCFVLDEKNGDEKWDDPINLKKARMAIFENGVNWYGDLIKSKQKYGLGVWAFEMQRDGKTNDTKTTYSILPDKKIDSIKGLKEQLDKVKLLDLENPLADADREAGSSKSSNGAISDADADSLIKELKQLERPDMDKFLEKFEVKRVRTLPANKLADAHAWVAERKTPPAEEKEADPFD